jgi:hypothetical protein
MNHKFLLFTTGNGSADPLNWSSDEAALYSTSELKGMKAASARSVDLFFETTYGKEVVTLGIKNSTHVEVMKSITTSLNSNSTTVSIADVDNSTFCSPHIISVKITSQETYCQKLVDDDKTKLNLARSNYSSCLIANTDSADISLDLYIASQVSTDTTSTTVLAAETEAISASSVTLTVDTIDATADVFLDERVYITKANGEVVFVGVCTGVTNVTTLVFSGGLEHVITNNDILRTGTRYNSLKGVVIPTAATLKLESNEISFDKSIHALYAMSSHSSGLLTFTFNY